MSVRGAVLAFAVCILVAHTAAAVTINVKTNSGAVGDGVTDDTLAIRNAAADLQAAKGGTLYFPPGKYKIFSPGTVWQGGFVLASFTDLTGVTIRGEGATIMIDENQTFDGWDASGWIFRFVNCTNVVVDGFSVTGPVMPISNTDSSGVNFVQLEGGSKNVRIPNNKVSGCMAAVNVRRDSGQAKSENIWIGNLDVQNCFYAINTNDSGDNLTAEHVTTYQVHRSYVTDGTRNHKLKIVSRGSWGYNCVISSTAENIELDYTSGADFSGSSPGHAHVRLKFGLAASYLRNIILRLNITYGASTAGGPAVRFDKESTAAQTLDGLTISGYVKGQPNSTNGNIVGPIIGSDEWTAWSSSDRFSNIVLRDLRVESSKAIRFILPGLVGPVTIDNVHSDNAIQLSQSASDFSPPSGGSYTITGSQFANRTAPVPGIANPLEYIYGGGNRTIPTGWSGHTITNIDNASGVVWSLPPAVPGLEYTIVRSNIFFINLDPNGTELIRGGAPGKYLALASDGANVRLRCLTAGTWEIISSSGTLLFEP